MDGSTIATPSRSTPRRTQPATRKPSARPRAKAVPPYRPNYWLVAGVVILVTVLAIVFLVTILILWSLTGPLTTAVMVAGYAMVMYALWRIGISRL